MAQVIFQAAVNISTFILLLRLHREGGMSPLPVRKDSGGKVMLLWTYVCLCAYTAEAFEVVAAVFHLTLHTQRCILL